MLGFFIAAVVLLQVGASQYMHSVQNPSLMPPRVSSWKFFHGFGLLASAGALIMFVAGFFFFAWWAPLVGLVGGMFLSQVLPERLSQPGLVYLSTLAALPLVFISLQAV